MSNQSKKAIDQLLQSMEKPSSQALYHQLGRLRNEMPPWNKLGLIETSQWSGRVLAVVEAAGCFVELISLRGYFEFVARNQPGEKTWLLIAQTMDAVLAKLELKVPSDMQGAFIPAGGLHDGYHVVSKAAASAQKSVFFVDAYADDTLVSDFVPLAPEGVTVFILSDEKSAKPSLKPGAERWVAQWQTKRPLQVRLAPPKSIHDRLLVIDSSVAYVVGQSFKDLAKRAHSSLVRMDPDSAALKVEAHITMWHAANVVL